LLVVAGAAAFFFFLCFFAGFDVLSAVLVAVADASVEIGEAAVGMSAASEPAATPRVKKAEVITSANLFMKGLQEWVL
jgi:hypothetical protein